MAKPSQVLICCYSCQCATNISEIKLPDTDHVLLKLLQVIFLKINCRWLVLFLCRAVSWITKDWKTHCLAMHTIKWVPQKLERICFGPYKNKKSFWLWQAAQIGVRALYNLKLCIQWFQAHFQNFQGKDPDPCSITIDFHRKVAELIGKKTSISSQSLVHAGNRNGLLWNFVQLVSLCIHSKRLHSVIKPQVPVFTKFNISTAFYCFHDHTYQVP